MSKTFRQVKRTMLPEPIPRADLERQLAEARAEIERLKKLAAFYPHWLPSVGEKGA